MARIVCQVLHRPHRITLIWSEGPASFEPYHLAEKERDAFLHTASEINAALARGPGADPLPLAQLGHQLYRQLFRLGGADPAAGAVHAWFTGLASENQVESVEFLCDDSARFPWNVLVSEALSADSLRPGGEGWSRFWGARFNLGAGRRVNALRSLPVLQDTTELIGIDPDLLGALSEAHTAELKRFDLAGTMHKSVESFASELKKTDSDFVLVLARFEQGKLQLGTDSFDATDVQTWLAHSNPYPLFILMATGNGADQAAWQTFLSSATGAIAGLVANEVLLAPDVVFGLGSSLLRNFLQSQRTIGEELRHLRASSGMAGLPFTGFCPVGLRVFKEGAEAAVPEGESMPLPAMPFHPFAAYEAADRPLFYGRLEETIACASLIDQAMTSMVVLHGAPGDGKTSFLQAGLLPYLELDSVGYRVLRDRTPIETPVAETDYPVLILRCTDDLAGQFADALAVFCAQPFTYTTPLGQSVVVDLPAILASAIAGKPSSDAASTAIEPREASVGIEPARENSFEEDPASAGPSVQDLWVALRDRKDLLASLLEQITRSLPFELVIVVDQGEELITLVHVTKQVERRHKAIEMLLQLSTIGARCKLLYTLSSHSLGKWISLLPHGRTPDDWRIFFLPMLTRTKMVHALLWPTHREEIPYAQEIPFRTYGFAFEEAMAEQIVDEAGQSAASDLQSPLPILHAVGALLFEHVVQKRQQNTLHMADLKEFGGVKEALHKYLDLKLDALRLTTVSRAALRGLIAKLYTGHTDGTVTRNLVPATTLKNYWERSSEPVEQVVNTAAEEAGLFEIQQLMVGGRHDVYVSLPQDSLAQIGRQIDSEKKRDSHARTSVGNTLWIMIPLVFFAAALSFFLTRNFASGNIEEFKTEFIDKTKKEVEQLLMEASEAQVKAIRETRRPLYHGLLAQADQAMQGGNALRARQILLSQPAMRSFTDVAKKNEKAQDLRGFEWKYLWKKLNNERFLLEGHRGIVTSVAVSPDSQRAATASNDGTIRVWNLSTGEILALLGEGTTPVHAVAFSVDGKMLASAGADKTVRLWDIGDLSKDYAEIPREKTALTGHTEPVLALAFGKEPNTLASAGADHSVILWNLAQGKVRHVLKDHASPVQALAFAADGKTLLSAGAEAPILVWDVDVGKKKSTIPTKYHSIAALAFSPDGKTLASGGVERKLGADVGMVRFWNVTDAKESRASIQHGDTIYTLSFHPDGDAIAAGSSDPVVRLWDVASSRERQHWLGHLGAVRSLAFTTDGSSLVTGSFDASAKVWNPAQSSGPDVIAAHKEGMLALALNRKNSLLASGSSGGGIKLWDAATGRMLLALPTQNGAVTSLAFSSHLDKTLLAAGTRDEKNEGEIKIWQIDLDKEGLKAKDRHTLKKHRQAITALAFQPNPIQADLLISGSADRSVILWDAETGKDKETYRGHKDEVRCVAFAPDGKTFASGGRDRQVCFYDVGSKDHSALTELHLASIETIALLNIPVPSVGNVQGLLTGSADQTMRLWAYDKNEKGQMDRKAASVYRSHVQPITTIVSGGDLLVSSSMDGSIRLYDLLGERFMLQGHVGAVRALALASDQSFLASASDDGTLRIWRASQPRPAAQPVEK